MRPTVLDWFMIFVGYGSIGALLGMAMCGAVSMVRFVFPAKGKKLISEES